MRFHEKEARPMGRSAGGVRGIKLKEEDEVVAASIAREAKTLLIVTDKGYGKRTEMENFTSKHRAGQGVVGIKLSKERGMNRTRLMTCFHFIHITKKLQSKSYFYHSNYML